MDLSLIQFSYMFDGYKKLGIFIYNQIFYVHNYFFYIFFYNIIRWQVIIEVIFVLYEVITDTIFIHIGQL